VPKFEQLKNFRETDFSSLDHLGKYFPKLLGYLLTTIYVVLQEGRSHVTLQFNRTAYATFIEDFGEALKQQHFDLLDDIFLKFIEKYHVPAGIQEIPISILKKDKDEFIKVCNNFKGKSWLRNLL